MTPARLDAFVPPPPSGRRAEVLAMLTERIADVAPGARAVVALDGVDGAGKTVLARELTMLLTGRREVHRASVDGVHRPRNQRYSGGRTPKTYYLDSFDHDALRHLVVEPFRAGSNWRTAVFDVELDLAVTTSPEPPAGPDAVLLVDGVFLHRPELADLWDASLWVDVPFTVAVPRGNARFGPVGAEAADPSSAQNARYVGGQRLYLDEVRPRERATWVLDNTVLDRPRLLR